METFAIKNLNFSYPDQEQKALDNVFLTVEKGDFFVLIGQSGCGKTTLLRHLKSCLTPHGARTGEVLFEGQKLDNMDLRSQSQNIGFILQSPENQIVTDKVWHELAFGLESLGYDTPTIRKKVAEMASFFGIQNWFYKNVSELSGGQKQILNLASVLALNPHVLILDEPTSQLDPISASDFLAILTRVNRELGITVILTEHRLEEVLPVANKVAVMEKGRITYTGGVKEVGERLKKADSAIFGAMPVAMRVWAECNTDMACPVTIGEGSKFLTEYVKGVECALPIKKEYFVGQKEVLTAEDLFFKYEKNLPDVVKGLNFKLYEGELFCLLGGNGTGKTTALTLLSGLNKPYRGNVRCSAKVGVLPQNPQTLFLKKTVYEDLAEMLAEVKDKDEKEKRLNEVIRQCKLSELLNRHPYDLSGGEQQRLALAKVLLTDADILFMDEPTKGFDVEFKESFAAILKQLTAAGKSVFMISHDVEFCAEYADRCALFFDGNIVTEGTPQQLFTDNQFYTTSANRMARHLFKEVITADDILLRLNLPIKQKTVSSGVRIAQSKEITEPLQEEKSGQKSVLKQKLPLWRKIIAIIFGLLAAAVFVYAIINTDLSEIVTGNGLSSESTTQLVIEAVFILLLFVVVLAVTRRSAPSASVQTPREKRKLTKRTLVATMLILLVIPVTLFIWIYYFGFDSYNIVSIAVLLECMLPFFLVFEGRKPKARELVIIAVLVAVGVAGRSVFFMLPQFKPVLALTIIAGVAFGGETGFLVGALTMLISNMIFGQGPWTPWQMFATGIIGFLAGVLFKKGWLRRNKISLAVFGAICAVVVYGGIMNPASALMWSGENLSWSMIFAYYLTGFPMDLVHAFATAFFLIVIAEPMLEKLDRIKTKYGLVE